MSISILDESDFSCSFENRKLSLFHDSKFVGFTFCQVVINFYSLDTIISFNESLQLSTRGLKTK